MGRRGTGRHRRAVRRGTERIDAPFDGIGLRFQVDEVHRCLDAGRIESSVMPLDESIGLATTMDAIRAEVGVVYPEDEPVG